MWGEEDRKKLEEMTDMKLKAAPGRLLRHAINQLKVLITLDEKIPQSFQSFRRDMAISEIIGGLEQYVEEIYGNERKSIEQN